MLSVHYSIIAHDRHIKQQEYIPWIRTDPRTDTYTKTNPDADDYLSGHGIRIKNNAPLMGTSIVIVETAKANGLDSRKYIEYLLTVMPGFGYNRCREHIEELMPWTDEVQKQCR